MRCSTATCGGSARRSRCRNRRGDAREAWQRRARFTRNAHFLEPQADVAGGRHWRRRRALRVLHRAARQQRRRGGDDLPRPCERRIAESTSRSMPRTIDGLSVNSTLEVVLRRDVTPPQLIEKASLPDPDQALRELSLRPGPSARGGRAGHGSGRVVPPGGRVRC